MRPGAHPRRAKEIVTYLTVGFLALLISLLFVNGVPVKYFAGIVFILAAVFFFFYKPAFFLVILFLLRASCDRFLQDVRIAGVGMGGILCMVIIAGTFAVFLVHRVSLTRLHKTSTLLLFSFCFASFLSLFLAAYPLDFKDVFFEVLRRFSSFSIFILVTAFIRTEKDAMSLLKAISFSAVPALGLGVAVYGLREIDGRLLATFGHPNILAFFLLVTIGCVILLMDIPPDKPQKFSFRRICYLCLMTGALLMTETRSAWLALAFMVMIYTMLFKRRLLIPVVLIGVLLASTPIVSNRIMNLFSSKSSSFKVNKLSSLGYRLDKWNELMVKGVERPIFGNGIDFGNFYSRDTLDPHNDYVRFFVEQGIFGLFSFVATYVYILMHALKTLRVYQPTGVMRKVTIFIICYIPAYLLMSVSENLIRYITIHWYVWAIIGVYFGLWMAQQEKLKAPEATEAQA